MIKTFKYRLYPSRRQTDTLTWQHQICAELYNAALQERREAWKLQRKSISYFDQTLQLKDIKLCRPEIAQVNSNVLENVLKRVHLAFGAFFRRVKHGHRSGYPRFRSGYRYDSLTFRQVPSSCIHGNRVRVSKVGDIRIRMTRPIDGTIKTLTIKREAGRWFALFACEVQPVPLPFSSNMIGVDVGLTHFATLSTGEQIASPRYYRAAERALRVAQRRVARRKKASHRRRKAVLLLQRTYVAIRNQRADFHHKLSRRLVNENSLIAVEDLNVKGLASGMLSKSVHDAGWSSFIFMLSYKAESARRLLIKVDPRGTSQTCLCGASVRKTLSVREHICTACGLVADRDHVSAQLILRRASVLPSGANVEVFDSCVA